jgi:hypothetical protein
MGVGNGTGPANLARGCRSFAEMVRTRPDVDIAYADEEGLTLELNCPLV